MTMYGPTDSVVGIPETTRSRVPRCDRRMYRTGPVAVLVTMIYYNESIQSKIIKGKGMWDQYQKKPRVTSQ